MSKVSRVELPAADVRTPVTDAILAPASKDPSTLPFRTRSWPDFERILLQYAEHVDGLRSVRIYGVPGQAQHGIDLYGTDHAGKTIAYQAKNVKRFTAASLRAAVKKFMKEPPPLLDVRHLVVCTACGTDDKKVGEELAKQRTENPDLQIELYDERTLSEGLRGRPDLVRRLFGASWQVAFCDDAPWEVPERTPIDVLADSLVRGPLEALGLAEGLNQADTVAESDPAHAAGLIGNIIDRLAAEGFPGTTGTLRRQRAELLVAAGEIDEAAAVFADLAWADRTNAGVDDDRHAEGRLRALAKERELPAVTLLVDAIDAVDRWHEMPQADLSDAIDRGLQVHAAGHPLAPDLILWVVETAVADRQVMRDGPLIEAVHQIIRDRASAGLADELVVRLRTAVADLGGDWTSVLRDARAGWLGARMATLVHARYGRHLYLSGQSDDAQAEYSAAVQVACQAHLGDEAADALYSITQTRLRYGPLEEDINALPRMAIDLRRQGHTSSLLIGRDPADAGAESLANGKLPSAFRHYRAAIRHAVIRGAVAAERSAHHHVAEILMRSEEPVAAIPHIIRNGSTDLIKDLRLPVYVDLRGDVLEGAYWERATALSILANQSDLVPDDHVADYLNVALSATSEPNWSLFGPHVSLMAWKAIASVADRFSEPDASGVLAQLEQYIAREPNHYRHTDDDHVAAVARIYESHPSLVAQAAEHLGQMVLQDFNLGETVRRSVRRSISDPSALLDWLRPHGASHEAAARILDDYGEQPEESLESVAQRIEVLMTEPAPKPGVYSFGTQLPNLAQRARGLKDKRLRDRLVEYCMSLAEDETRPASNRSEGMEGVLLLARSVDDATRADLFDRALPLARLDLPPTAVDMSLAVGNHPLSPFNVNLDHGALPRFALQAIAFLAETPQQAKIVQDRAISWLTGDEHDTYAVAQALDALDPTQVTIELSVLAGHPSQWLRQVAAVLAARADQPLADVLRNLATDGDRQVRRTVAHSLSQVAKGDKKLAAELREMLGSDPSWMVRKAASDDLPLDEDR